jgi:hypothetical protein
MPVRNRRYENILQFIFGAVLCAVILDVLYKALVRLIAYLVHYFK